MLMLMLIVDEMLLTTFGSAWRIKRVREAAKKSSSTSGRATKRGGKGRAIKEKITFFLNFCFILLPFKKIQIILL